MNGFATAEREPGRPRLSRVVYLFTACLIAGAALALLMVGRIASQEADALAVAGERRLFDNALSERFRQQARGQLGLARWDEAVSRIVKTLDRDFVVGEFVDSLWHDFGLDRNYLIGSDGRLFAASRGEEVDFTAKTLARENDLARLAEQARARHLLNRISIAGGYRQRHVTGQDIGEIAEFVFVRLNGIVALATAMAIVPDDKTVLGEGAPVILIATRRIDADFVKALKGQLGFEDLSFIAGKAGPPASARHTIKGVDGVEIGGFVWSAARPGSGIWSVVVPVVLLLAGALGLAALVLARRIGALSVRLEASEAQNRFLAHHDALSGLANRAAFDRALEGAAARLPLEPFAVLACDLDRFKAVNDTMGHAAGDAVIRAVAERLRACVGETGLVGRVGGDEFVVLMSGFTDRPRLTVLAGQIIAGICEPVVLDDGRSADVGVSIGIAVAPRSGETANGIMAAADVALYAAKDRGRGCAVIHGEHENTPPTGQSPDPSATPDDASHVA